MSATRNPAPATLATVQALRAAGDTHCGLLRDVNEDRFHCDAARGLFIVVDGIGGQAAGGKAADVAMSMLRARLERETGAVVDRIREAIAIANNEIRRLAALRPEWRGMACVLTVAVVEDGRATIGHVGDTRLYKIRGGRIEKITRDHSPVGEREDAHEISELEAMRHPRRNEVYRDVGSEPHEPHDAGFIDVDEIDFEPDSALVLCSDGLTDLVDSAAIHGIVTRLAGQPADVARELIAAANDAGGRDNVTVVYVEGETFAPTAGATDVRQSGATPNTGSTRPGRASVVRAALVVLIALVLGFAAYAMWRRGLPQALTLRPTVALAPLANDPITVAPSGSIAAALASAAPGTSVLVEPGEYRERLVLPSGVRVVSRVPRAATLRLPSNASEADPAIVADGVEDAELNGFRIVGDAATPLGTGIRVSNAHLTIVDVEITGAAHVAVDIGGAALATILGSHVHDNPGTGLAIRRGAAPRISQNVFARNGLSERSGAAIVIEPDAQPALFGNVFQGVSVDALRALGDAAAARAAHDNWFVDAREPAGGPSATGRAAQGRKGLQDQPRQQGRRGR